MTALDQAICDELRTLHAVRQELAGQRAGLENEVHVAQQTERLLTRQIEALQSYLGACGVAMPADLRAPEGPTHG